MNNYINVRTALVFLTVLSIGLFGASLYFQYIDHLEPCPLCIAQRISVLFLGITYLCALFITRSTWRYINTFFQFLFSIFGASMAGRQVWLIQTPPSERPGCMPDITLLWQYLPFKEVIHAFLNGTESCVESTWTFQGLNMPEWMLGFFIFFIIASVGLAIQRNS